MHAADQAAGVRLGYEGGANLERRPRGASRAALAPTFVSGQSFLCHLHANALANPNNRPVRNLPTRFVVAASGLGTYSPFLGAKPFGGVCPALGGSRCPSSCQLAPRLYFVSRVVPTTYVYFGMEPKMRGWNCPRHTY